jgi:hypothetical protein
MLLNLAYKGNRNYLHGTDIFNALESYFQSRGGFLTSLSFRSFAKKQLEIRLKKPILIDTLPQAEGLVRYPTFELPFWLVESDQDVNNRYSYDERLITQYAIIDFEDIRILRPNHFTLIENIVAITKYLSNIKYPLNSGKWIFGKIKLDQAMPSVWESILISKTAFLEGRFGRYNVCIDKAVIGEIYFIVSSL